MTVKIRTHTKFYFQVGHSNLGTHLIDTVTYFLQAVWFQKYTDYRLQMNLRFFHIIKIIKEANINWKYVTSEFFF